MIRVSEDLWTVEVSQRPAREDFEAILHYDGKVLYPKNIDTTCLDKAVERAVRWMRRMIGAQTARKRVMEVYGGKTYRRKDFTGRYL